MAKPAYAGPKPLAEALSELRLARGEDAKFHREGLRAGSEYRDLGLAAATGGRLGMRHIRAVGGDFSPPGWHWHDMQAHLSTSSKAGSRCASRAWRARSR